jgi:hypothetical protein
MRHRNPRSQQQQRRRDVQYHAQDTGAVDFFNVLTSAQMQATTEAHMPKYRERLYSPTVTLSMFMRQALEEDASCQKAVNGWAAQRAADGLTPMSVRTGGYCRARQRLPLAMVQVRISAIVDGHFSLIVDGETASSRARRGGAQVRGGNVAQPSTISLKRLLAGACLGAI